MMLAGTIRDLRWAARGLARRPASTAVLVLTLGLTVGAVTSVFGVVNASLIRALPFDRPDELVFLQGAFQTPAGPEVRGASPAEARDWEAMSRSFMEVSAFLPFSMVLTGGDHDAERLAVEGVDEGYFELLSVSPVAGRTFTAEEYAPGSDRRVVVLGEGLWTRRFGRDPEIIGKSVALNDRSWDVVGIVPEGFGGLRLDAELWAPLVAGGVDFQYRGARFLDAVARLRTDVSLEDARADMAAVARRLEELYPEVNRNRTALVTPLRDTYVAKARTLMLVVLAATGLLLLIAVTNVTNLLLVRASFRGPEISIRRSLGAGRGALTRQFLVESVLHTAVGSAAGLVLGFWGAGALGRAMPDGLLPAYVNATPDAFVFAVLAGGMALLGMVVGVAPAFGSAGGELGTKLRRGRSRPSLLGTLVAGEVALALLLLVGAGLMVRSFQSQLAVDTGVDTERLLALRVEMRSARYRDREARSTAAEALLERLAAVPGVRSAALAGDAPLRGLSGSSQLWIDDPGPDDDRIRYYSHSVHPDWFQTLGIDIIAGSGFTHDDAAAGANVAVISRAMAERHFRGQDPVGRSLVLGPADGPRFSIVGVAEDVRYRDLTSDLVGAGAEPDVYVPWPRFSAGTTEILVRTDGDPGGYVPPVRRALIEFDPALPPFEILPMTGVLRRETAQGRLGSLLLGGFSALATILAAVGLYGVLSFTVARRSREIALRVALGADAGRVRRMVLADGLRLTALGLGGGVAAALVASRALEGLLFGVRPVDAATYATVAALMAIVACLATWVPAWRASRVDPQRMLASE